MALGRPPFASIDRPGEAPSMATATPAYRAERL
jgi:hypothetical protein